MIDGFIAELTGLSLPGELTAAFAFFVAFFAGGRIGGSGFFWLGILLFGAIQAFSFGVVLGVMRDIQQSGGGASTVTWVSVFAESWLSTALSLVASIVGLILGRRGALPNSRNITNAA